MRIIRSLFAPGVALTLVLTASSVSAAGKKDPPKPTVEECLACHSDASLTHEVNGKQVSLHVDPEAFKNSIHGSMFTCVDCHSDVKSAAHETTPKKISCATCHADQQAAYDRSHHAQAVASGNSNAATCVDCHGSPHELLPASDPKSRVSHANIPATCGACHGQKFVMADGGQSAQMVASYGAERSRACRGQWLRQSRGLHRLSRHARDPGRKRFEVPDFQIQCAADLRQVPRHYRERVSRSIHGQALAQGNSQAPACTDCHGIHSIKAHTDPNSPVSAQNVAQATCARCHEGVRLSQEFGIAGRRETTYLASYHGLASKRGRRSSPTAPVATGRTAFSRPLIRAPRSIPAT